MIPPTIDIGTATSRAYPPPSLPGTTVLIPPTSYQIPPTIASWPTPSGSLAETGAGQLIADLLPFGAGLLALGLVLIWIGTGMARREGGEHR